MIQVKALFGGGGSLSSLRVTLSSFEEGKEKHCCREEYNVIKNGKEKQYHLPYNIEAVGKNIKWVEGEGNFGGRNQDLKNIYIYVMGLKGVQIKN